MASAIDDALFAVLRAFALAIPSFAAWLADAIAGKDDPISLRIADILPARTSVHDVRDRLRAQSPR